MHVVDQILGGGGGMCILLPPSKSATVDVQAYQGRANFEVVLLVEVAMESLGQGLKRLIGCGLIP